MRAASLAFVTSTLVFIAGVGPSAAADYAYCIQGDEFSGGAGECIFATQAQCQASASGRMASCAENRNLGAHAQLIDKSRVHHRLH